MIMSIFFCLLLSVFVGGQQPQVVHYVPAHILIPTFNASDFNVITTNSSGTWNNTWGAPPPLPPPAFNYTGPNSRPPLNQTGFWYGHPANKSQFFNGTTPDGNLIVGTVGYMDRLLFNQVYFKARRWWSSRGKTIEYPKDVPGGYVRPGIITAIRAYNQFYDGAEATAKIVDGGIGRQYVKIELRSGWGKGFKYLVQIFGR